MKTRQLVQNLKQGIRYAHDYIMSVASFHFRKSCILKSVQPNLPRHLGLLSSFTDDNLSTSWSNSPLFLESDNS